MKFLKQSAYIRYFIVIQFLTEEYLKIKKAWNLLPSQTFYETFNITINWPNLITRLCLLSKLFSKTCFMFHS